MRNEKAEDRLVYKSKSNCVRNHKNRVAIYVCLHAACKKEALCEICVNENHSNHCIAKIDTLSEMASDKIDEKMKLIESSLEMQ